MHGITGNKANPEFAALFTECWDLFSQIWKRQKEEEKAANWG